MYKMLFDDTINCKYCCNNYIYNRGEVGELPVFEAYNVTAKLGVIYAGIPEYSDLLLSSNHQRLLARNLPKGPRIAVEQTCVCQ